MIAIKNHQYLHELLTQEELIRAVASHYLGMTGDAKVKTLYNNIIRQSEKNSADILGYLQSRV